jgi:hypothetical protein
MIELAVEECCCAEAIAAQAQQRPAWRGDRPQPQRVEEMKPQPLPGAPVGSVRPRGRRVVLAYFA